MESETLVRETTYSVLKQYKDSWRKQLIFKLSWSPPPVTLPWPFTPKYLSTTC